MKRFLGIDYGTKRVGLALSDEAGCLAFPEKVLLNSPNLAKTISEICAQNKVSRIVLGQSLSSSGAENPVQAEITKLKIELEQASGLLVCLEPEIFSTSEASRYQKGRGLKDASAAAIILQRFLEKNKKRV
ncbi:hypothetical protein A3I25_00820 [Candidatus Nomurabacteria bacterium RIFCSPLOWO2_02_FULL_42_17]|uniref:Putative pre-16S rRNA nuclease n=2 Tax=Candidatus Nomuraibacteriota TaxID=1752729 RepID=A0A1F6WIC9_9BACT|nr:MAG: hypothetical protein UV08_C0032G0028 [Parcubacteria group bacterium GW2011_GWA2_42_18]OGI81648.1 MAG: hypothetical protein A3B93_02210 [Candidatus Nomurabacteria bacterium RIFCSPHIGHO2_02_FULL_42_24]OGI96995.1 MAG: hypothetical protein A3I25_00820 [Candidatus Nomurabacteria bacterium RIFCSPLOWO2_02_FULL_42_17]